MALSTEEIWHRIGQITVAYPLLECDKCAISISRWLERWEVEGQILRLRTKRRSEVFITSGRIGGNESITENGTHYGVEVLGKVFDKVVSSNQYTSARYAELLNLKPYRLWLVSRFLETA